MNDDIYDKIHTDPVDRLTRLCDAMSEAMDTHPELKPGDRAVIMVDSPEDKRGGIVIHGYDEGDTRAAIIDLFMHMRSMMRAHGITMEMIFPDLN